jgi:hypothetical protein
MSAPLIHHELRMPEKWRSGVASHLPASCTLGAVVPNPPVMPTGNCWQLWYGGQEEWKGG